MVSRTKLAATLAQTGKRWWAAGGTGTGTVSSTTTTRTFASKAQSASGADTSKQLQKARRFSPGVGFVAGMFGSMIGVGGGVLMNPMILSMCNSIPQRVLTGTSLGAVISTALASGSVFMSHDSVDVASASLIAASAMLTAPIGARLTSRLDCRQLRKILGYFLLGAAPLVPLKAVLATSPEGGDGAAADEEERSSEPNDDGIVATIVSSLEEQFRESPLAAVQMLAIGGTAGLFSGLLGIGGGTIVTPLLALTTQLDQYVIDHHFPRSRSLPPSLSLALPHCCHPCARSAVILGTSMTGMIAPSIAGMVQHYRMGNVDPRLLAGLALGTSAGGLVGSKIVVSDLPPGSLETLFCLGMLFLGRKTLKSIK